jgi:hypothetical protein
MHAQRHMVPEIIESNSNQFAVKIGSRAVFVPQITHFLAQQLISWHISNELMVH